MIRVVMVDDHPLLRDGLKARFNAEPDIEVVGEAENGAEACDVCARLQPDIVLLDINMSAMSGLDAMAGLTGVADEARVIILTMHDDPQYLRRALRAGVKGYVLKDAGGAEIVRAIHAVNSGGTYFSEAVSRHLIDDCQDGDTGKALSAREVEVLALLADGLTNKDIANTLCISSRTVESHRANIKCKLGASSFAELLRYAVEQGYIRT